MNIGRLRHIAIVVRSMERMLAFYRDILGCTITRDSRISGNEFECGIGLPGATARCVHLSIPGSTVELELFEFDPPNQCPGAVQHQEPPARPCIGNLENARNKKTITELPTC